MDFQITNKLPEIETVDWTSVTVEVYRNRCIFWMGKGLFSNAQKKESKSPNMCHGQGVWSSYKYRRFSYDWTSPIGKPTQRFLHIFNETSWSSEWIWVQIWDVRRESFEVWYLSWIIRENNLRRNISSACPFDWNRIESNRIDMKDAFMSLQMAADVYETNATNWRITSSSLLLWLSLKQCGTFACMLNSCTPPSLTFWCLNSGKSLTCFSPNFRSHLYCINQEFVPSYRSKLFSG